MKGEEWLLKAIFSESLKLDDISFFRELFKEETSDKRIRLQMVKRMMANSDGMKKYIYQEKVITIMAMLASEIHWHLIFAVNSRDIADKKALVGWDEKYRRLLLKRSAKLKERLFDLRGKWKYGDLNSDEIIEAIDMLEDSAEGILEEIESYKTRGIDDSSQPETAANEG